MQFVKGQKVASTRSDYQGLAGEVESVEHDRVLVRWRPPNDPNVTWSTLEDARRLIPAA